MNVEGLSTLPSHHGPRQTMDRLEAAIRAKGMSVFARVDHAAGAEAAGLPLAPTELLVFGSAKVGTALMQAVPTSGIDLPLKALVWQDAAGQTWLSWNEPEWVGRRHGLGSAAAAAIAAMSSGLAALARQACAVD
jgi:uncharacterized protein (DUF302 family)